MQTFVKFAPTVKNELIFGVFIQKNHCVFMVKNGEKVVKTVVETFDNKTDKVNYIQKLHENGYKEL